jgi:nucleotide-binding universal stress UspA family protein
MFPLKRILLPVNFSMQCRGAAQYARALACNSHAELTVLHVHETLPLELGGLEFGGPLLGGVPAQQLGMLEEEVAKFTLEALPGFPVKRLVVSGDPATRIAEQAHKDDSDLIVMPTHGYGPFRRLLLGSVTAKVLHDGQCPVWTGAHLETAQQADAISFGHVLCAVNLEPESRDVLTWAMQIATAFGSRITLLHVLPNLDCSTAEYFNPEWRPQFEADARKRIGELLDEVPVEVDVQLREGEIAWSTAKAASDLQADVVVIGRGAAGAMFGRLPSNAYSILRQSPCPVLSV